MYQLDDRGVLSYVEIGVMPSRDGLTFFSPIDGREVTILNMDEYDLSTLLKTFDGKFLSDFLDMVSEMGGGMWDDDPDGTQTQYEYDEENRKLIVREG